MKIYCADCCCCFGVNVMMDVVDDNFTLLVVYVASMPCDVVIAVLISH